MAFEIHQGKVSGFSEKYLPLMGGERWACSLMILMAQYAHCHVMSLYGTGKGGCNDSLASLQRASPQASIFLYAPPGPGLKKIAAPPEASVEKS